MCGCCGGRARGRCYRCAQQIATRRCECRCDTALGPLLPPSSREPLKAVTLLQPWASCMIPGPKTTENRTWKLTLPERGGRWLALHAALRFDQGVVAEPDAMVRQHLRRLWPEMPDFEQMPVGAMLGVIHVPAVDEIEPITEQDEWASGPIGWRVDYRIALREPLPCKGAQGLWNPPPAALAALWALFPTPLAPPPAQPDPTAAPAPRRPRPRCRECGEIDGHEADCPTLPRDGLFHRAGLDRRST